MKMKEKAKRLLFYSAVLFNIFCVIAIGSIEKAIAGGGGGGDQVTCKSDLSKCAAPASDEGYGLCIGKTATR